MPSEYNPLVPYADKKQNKTTNNKQTTQQPYIFDSCKKILLKIATDVCFS